MSNKRTLSFSEICEEVAAELANLDGEDLAKVASKILPARVTYEGDGVFTVKE